LRLTWGLLSVLVAVAIAGCATQFQSSGLTGGYDEKQLEPMIWRVSYKGNGYTTQETVQTYWLFRAAQLTLEQGFDGFLILSNIRLVAPRSPQREVKLAASSTPIFIPMYTGGPVYAPSLEGDIRMLKLPFPVVPGRIFIAAALKNELEPLVNGNKCDKGNVCPYVHHYLFEVPATTTPNFPPEAPEPAAPPPQVRDDQI